VEFGITSGFPITLTLESTIKKVGTICSKSPHSACPLLFLFFGFLHSIRIARQRSKVTAKNTRPELEYNHLLVLIKAAEVLISIE
jgi:hypothetical protein